MRRRTRAQTLGPAPEVATPARLATLYGVDAARIAASLPATGAMPR
jgi:iron complex transport system ATP-binding protein